MTKEIQELESVGPNYPWGVDGSNGYHLGTAPVAPILQEVVFPKLGKLLSGSVVADFGCGDGRLERSAPPLAQRSYTFLGIDKEPEAVARFNSTLQLPDRAIVGNIERLVLGERKFQTVLSWRVLHCLPPELVETAFRAIANSLIPGGRAFVSVLSDEDWKRKALEQRGLYRPGEMNECAGVMEVPEVKTWPLRFFRENELAQIGRRIGLTLVGAWRFQELTGFDTLKETHPLQDYDLVEFRTEWKRKNSLLDT